ncbi:MAG: GMC oxidoreductase [Planctomycetota bacterium]
MNDLDVIVVGAGTAGCVLASRLAESAACRIALIEAGSLTFPGDNADRLARLRPASWLAQLGGSDDWDYLTESSPGLAARKLRWPRGRGIGGSSRINAMIYFPVHQDDLEVLSEVHGLQSIAQRVKRASSWVERTVNPVRPTWISEATRRLLDASKAFDFTLAPYRRFNRNGQRWTPADLVERHASIRRVRGQVDQVLFRGDEASGVKLSDGRRLIARTVVLTGGTIQSPAILMRSGVGNRAQLERLGIPVRHDCPDVGQQLKDHLIMPVIYGLDTADRFRETFSMRELAQWQVGQTGRLTCNLAEAGGLIEDRTWQLHITPTHYLLHPSPRAPAAMTIGVNVTRPSSRGRLSLKSSDPDVAPKLEPNYLSEPKDVAKTVDGIARVRELIGQCRRQTGMDGWLGDELLPGPKRIDPESLQRAVSRYAQTLYHPVGTCRMGVDSASVVDADFAVRGVGGLHVVDASVLPEITLGNPSVMVMSLAHAAAETINSA